MSRRHILTFINQLKRPVFTTHELAASSGKSLSATAQTLKYLEGQGLILKVYRGIWSQNIGDGQTSPYSIIPFLLPRHRAYLSFISALHLYGIVEQIPQVMTLASTAHTRIISTKLGTFSIHQIAPSFFRGFDWYKGTGTFLIAEPEKALVDSLYLSVFKKKQFGYFPELHLAPSFNVKKAKAWGNAIPDKRTRFIVIKKLDSLL
jgi:predicted transcriptional regulator of viral defense system